MREEWKPVCDYEGLYEVSNLGRVRSVERTVLQANGRAIHIKEVILKEYEHNDVKLFKDGIYKNKLIRSLVAQSFLNIPYGNDITHLDRNFANSEVSNLMSTVQYKELDPNWRDIPGFEGVYQASKFGEIRSLDRYVIVKGGLRFCPGLVRVLELSDDGYYQVALYCQGKNITKNAHVFIAQAWIPNPENKPTVNHIDGNKQNNRIENLEWATYKEQQVHAIKTGLREQSYWRKGIQPSALRDYNERNKVKVRCIETGVEYDSITQAAHANNITPPEVKRSIDCHASCKQLHFVKACEDDYSIGIVDLDDEIWKPIPGLETRYKVSNKGRIKSVQRQCKCARGARTVPERLIDLSYGIHLLDQNGKLITYHMPDLQKELFE